MDIEDFTSNSPLLDQTSAGNDKGVGADTERGRGKRGANKDGILQSKDHANSTKWSTNTSRFNYCHKVFQGFSVLYSCIHSTKLTS